MTTPPGRKRVAVDCFLDGFPEELSGYSVVAVDVIRTSTTAITAILRGLRCFPVPSIEMAVPLAARLDRPILVGELGGNMPYGFDLTNSPFELDRHSDAERPMILLTTSGTRLIHEASRHGEVFVACLRNVRAQAEYLIEHRANVALVGAGTRGEFREEDQLCCAWLARELIEAGYEPEGQATEIVERWGHESADAITRGKSAQFLRDTGQDKDLEFIVSHIDDVQTVFRLEGDEIVIAADVAALRAR